MQRSPGNIPIQTVQSVEPPKVETSTLSGTVPLYHVAGGSEPVLHLELIFRAGKASESQPAVAHATASLLSEGTDAMSSRQIADELEYYGVTLRSTTGVDALSISLYSMCKMFEPALDILTQLLADASFPESELQLYKQNRVQKIRIAMGQNETIANKILSESVFGDHPYGRTTLATDVEVLTRDHLLQHYSLLGSHNLSVFLSGDVQDQHVRALDKMVGRLRPGQKATAYNSPEIIAPSKIHHQGPQKYQSAIRFGRQMISRRHPDFPAVFLLNAVLGGFFGARLMKNIREDKGLTYGIYSTLETLVEGSCFIISTEAATDKTNRVIEEIRQEVMRLHQDPVTEDELEMVRNYLMGAMLMQLDGPLRSMDMIKTMIMESLDEEYFRNFVSALRTTGSGEIQHAAQKYLGPEALCQIVVA